MAPVCYIGFLKTTGNFYSRHGTQSKCVITPNLVTIGRTVAEMRAGGGSWVTWVNEYGWSRHSVMVSTCDPLWPMVH